MYTLHWELWYFNYWLTHMFYFSGGLIVLFAIGSNKYKSYREKIKLLERLERHSKPYPYLPIPKETAWPLNQ